MKKIYYNYISIIILFFIAIAIGTFFVYQNKRNNNQEVNNNQKIEQEVINKETNSSNDNQGQSSSIDSNEDIKRGFRATEIVSNNLPESIEFWTEAYCPGSGTDYDYHFDKNWNYKYNYSWDYYLSSCEEGETGSHGGCPTCVMSKIKLSKDHNPSEQNFRNSIKFEDGVGVYIEKLGSTREESEVRVWKDRKMKQIFPSYIPIEQFWSDFHIYVDVADYNNDGYVDLSFTGGSEVSTHAQEHDFVFLYDPVKRDIDWDRQITIFYYTLPLYAIEEGDESGSTCSMAIYKDGKVLQDSLQCPENILSK